MLTQESGKDVLMYHLTEESFDIEVLREKGAVVVMFYERWCPKCSMTKPIVEEKASFRRQNTSVWKKG